MKNLIAVFCFLDVLACVALSDDIPLNDRVVTFTNLQGRLFEKVELTKATMDGVCYFTGHGGGMVCYTNLSTDRLVEWGLPTNAAALYLERKELERQRKQEQAWAAEQERKQRQIKLQAEIEESRKRAEEFDRTNVVRWQPRPYVTPNQRIGAY